MTDIDIDDYEIDRATFCGGLSSLDTGSDVLLMVQKNYKYRGEARTKTIIYSNIRQIRYTPKLNGDGGTVSLMGNKDSYGLYDYTWHTLRQDDEALVMRKKEKK